MRPLVDGHGRPIGDLRISVTDRCNFRCQYCMPAEGLPWLQRDALLTYEEIARLVALLSSMGVHDVRLTGGEPLVRRELWRLVEMLSGLEDVHDLSLTTNGYLLASQVDDLVRAGLERVNVSLDSLAPDRFFQLTRRDSLAQVLEGLEAAEAHPELRPIKVNVVALKDFTEDEVVRFADFARRTPYVVSIVYAESRARFRDLIGFISDDKRQKLDTAGASSTRSIRSRPSAASATAPRGAGASPTATARSASSPPSPRRSAATATASA